MKIFKKTKPKLKIVLLRAACPALEKAINLKLQQNPNLFANYGDYANPFNYEMDIGKDWSTLSFIAVKENADVNNLEADDLLVFCGVSIKRPHCSVVGQVGLISFCDDINVVLETVSLIKDRLNTVYGVDNIGFTAVEGETTYRLFNLVMSSQELTDKYFKGWIGRYIGYKTNNSCSQSGKLRNLHLFEILKINNI